jgi:tol-pal system protein YbgF
MSARRRRTVSLAPLALVCVLAGLSMPAGAGIFDDDVARADIDKTRKDLGELRSQNADEHKKFDEFRQQANATLERHENALKIQAEHASQLDALRGDLAKLRGLLEEASNKVEEAGKRQTAFYLDLDGRLRKLEGSFSEFQAKAAEAATQAAAKPKVDPAAETRLYEEALELFKASKYKDAQTAFANHLRDYPGGPLAASAQFWLANTLYVQQDCKGAIDAHNVVVSKYPDSNKAPDSLLAIATCQQELKDLKAARATMEKLVAAFPKSSAAETARQRLKRK